MKLFKEFETELDYTIQKRDDLQKGGFTEDKMRMEEQFRSYLISEEILNVLEKQARDQIINQVNKEIEKKDLSNA